MNEKILEKMIDTLTFSEKQCLLNAIMESIKHDIWIEKCRENGKKGGRPRKQQEKSPEENKYAKYGIVTRK